MTYTYRYVVSKYHTQTRSAFKWKGQLQTKKCELQISTNAQQRHFIVIVTVELTVAVNSIFPLYIIASRVTACCWIERRWEWSLFRKLHIFKAIFSSPLFWVENLPPIFHRPWHCISQYEKPTTTLPTPTQILNPKPYNSPHCLSTPHPISDFRLLWMIKIPLK